MKNTILFLAANPSDTDRLALDREMRSIQDELRFSGHRAEFALEARWAMESIDLLREMRRLKPTIVHFSGHGDGDATSESRLSGQSRDVWPGTPHRGGEHGLFFQGPGGGTLISTRAIADTFGAVGNSVKLVVLNACYTDMQAEALSQHVDCVIGIPASLPDEAALAFALGLYGALGQRQSVEAAFRQGRAAISLHGLLGHEPLLRVRHGIAADEVFLDQFRW